MDTLVHIINTVLDPIGIVVGLTISIPILWTWYEVVWGRKRRYRKYLKAIRQTPGKRSGILIVSLIPARNIRPAVENFCQQHSHLKDIPAERMFMIERNGLDSNALHNFQLEVRQKTGEIFAQGIDRIHYFHAGPSMAAAMVGAELGNGCTVVLYQHEGDSYIDYGLLKLPILPPH